MPDEPTTTVTEPPATPPAQAPEQAETDWKAEARKWEARAKENKAKLDDAAPKLTEYDRLVEASKTDFERKAEEVTRWQSEAEKWRTASVGSRIEALAAVDFADPSDAVGALDPSTYLDAGGQIDEAAIRRDLAEVLTKKPHWRRQEGATPSRVPAPNPAQGTSGTPASADPAAAFAAVIQGHLNGSR